ncbi:hypothetical protein ACIGC1_03145 [Peribacillus butanolivorans]|uniref:hypothetical protein n=1 Tax=Peribacillus butanolivorans TaxID=421767 RepID=UPI0037CBD9C3
MKELTEEEQKREIVKLNNLVEGIIGERPKFLGRLLDLIPIFPKKLLQMKKCWS